MKVVVSGGTGFIGSALVERLASANHVVVLLTRAPAAHARARANVVIAEWDGKSVGPWGQQIEGADAVVNLTGVSLAAKRWTQKQKEILVSSRREPARALVEAIGAVRKRPSVFLSASAVGYYGHVESDDVTEDTPHGDDFLASLTMKWETEASRATEYGVRVVTPRFGVVLDRRGVALTRLALPFRFFAGGWLGSGKQWFAWVHREDVVRAIEFTLVTDMVSGPLNLAAPDAVTNKEFCKVLGSVLHRPCWAAVPAPVLRLALGEMADMLLTGQKVKPTKLQEAGFSFQYPTLRMALQKIFQ